MPNPIAAVIFDLGGVVVDSPLHAIARYERDHGIEHNAINHAGSTGPGPASSAAS
jgi:beta-phosphoglucomutase-like phosphatase (HAD superfamily)